MIFKTKTKQALTREQALKCIPQKNLGVHEEKQATGDLILNYQAAYRPFFLKIRRLTNPSASATFERKIQLDALGTQVWEMIDGKKDVQTIIREFADHHTLDRNEARLSVTLFIKSLGEKGLIGLTVP